MTPLTMENMLSLKHQNSEEGSTKTDTIVNGTWSSQPTQTSGSLASTSM